MAFSIFVSQSEKLRALGSCEQTRAARAAEKRNTEWDEAQCHSGPGSFARICKLRWLIGWAKRS
eukprot:scaffold124187_cov31-Tisochrysis_lutea.AAC.2